MKSRLLLFLCIAVFTSACETRKPIVITEPTDLAIDVKLEHNFNGYALKGKTNLPDSTVLSISFMVDDNIRGQGKATVEYGVFSLAFGGKAINSDAVSVHCIKNSIVQPSDNIVKQLELIRTGKDEIESSFSMAELKRTFFNDLFTYKSPLNIDYSVVENVTEKPLIKVRRSQVDVIVKHELDSIELSKHIKHHLINQLVSNTSSKTVTVRCFKENEDISFAQGIFAPNGKWLDAGEDMRFQDYTLVIK